MNRNAHRHRQVLGRHLLARILLVSTLATTFFTTISFWLDYREEMSALKGVFQQVRERSVASLAKAVWEFDEEGLDLQVDGILTSAGLVSIVIEDEKGVVLLKKTRSGAPDSYLTMETWPLLHSKGRRNFRVGTVAVVATKLYMYERLKNKVVYFFFSQGLKTLIVSALILWIFRRLVIHHLSRMSAFVENFDYLGRAELRLQGKRRRPNELDILAGAINEMGGLIRKSLQDKDLEVRETRDELDRQKAASLYSARLASLGEMASGIAHEINNPLAIIDGHNSLIERLARSGGDGHNAAVIRSTQKISATVRRITDIVRGLLSFSRDGESVGWEDIPLHQLLGDVTGLCDARFQSKKICLEVELPPDLEEVRLHCNRVKIAQVLINLLNNAVDAVEKLENKWVRLGLERQGADLVISVTDAGSGIPVRLRERIMDPFFTTKEVGKGTGLGLSVSAGIAGEHGGRLEIDPESEHTRFNLVLPVLTDHSLARPTPPA